MILAVFFFSVSNLISKYLIITNKNLGFDSINLILGIVMLVTSYYMRKRELLVEEDKKDFNLVFNEIKNELKLDYKNTNIFIIRCFVGTLAEVFLFYSFKTLRISTSITLSCLSPILSSFLSYLFLDKFKSYTGKDFLILILCIFSVSFITKPEFIFHKVLSGEENSDEFIGFVHIFFNVLCNGSAYFFHKKIINFFDNNTINFFFGINFVIFSIFLSNLDKFTIFELDFMTYFLLFLSAIFFNINQSFFNLSLKYGDLIVVLPFTYLNVFVTFLYNIFFFKGAWDFFDIIGSIGVICINLWRAYLSSGIEE